MTWVEEWRAKHGAALAERDAQQAADRKRFYDIILRGLDAIDASPSERAIVFNRTGVGSPATLQGPAHD